MNKSFENCTLLDTKTWFEKARPDLTPVDFRVQLGVHLEEVTEMLEALDGNDVATSRLLGDAELALKNLADYLKANSGQDTITVTSEELFLDSLCDQIVTGTGVAHCRQYDIVGAMTEVNRSNFSKFDEAGNPIRNEVGKIMKGPNYSKAVLFPYLPK